MNKTCQEVAPPWFASDTLVNETAKNAVDMANIRFKQQGW